MAKGRDEYYTGKGEAPGEWFGAGAGALGLVGWVDADDFQTVVMAAKAPSGEVLRKVVGDKPVRGFDLTFSPPKSASLLFFLGEGHVSAAVRQAHDEAVLAALGYMEREACVVRAGKGGRGGKTVGGGLLERLADRFLESRHAVHVEGQPAVVGPDTIRRRDGRLVVRATGAKYSTPDMLECETRLVAAAAARKGEGAGTAGEGELEATLAARAGLGVEQEAMVRSLTRSGDGVEVVRAAAGTGGQSS